MTASAMEADRKACQHAGMVRDSPPKELLDAPMVARLACSFVSDSFCCLQVDFVAKPVNLSSFRSKIEQWAEKVIAQRALTVQQSSLPRMAGVNVAGAGKPYTYTPFLQPRKLTPVADTQPTSP